MYVGLFLSHTTKSVLLPKTKDEVLLSSVSKYPKAKVTRAYIDATPHPKIPKFLLLAERSSHQ